MKFLFKVIVLLTIIALNSCSKEEKEISLIKEIDQEDEMILAYKEGVKNLDEGDAFYAAKKFETNQFRYTIGKSPSFFTWLKYM